MEGEEGVSCQWEGQPMKQLWNHRRKVLWFSMETSLAVVVGWVAVQEEAMVSVSRRIERLG